MKAWKIHGAAILAALWLALAAWAWLSPSQEISLAERRKLQQLPALTRDTLASGEFMSEFEDYALDQFPLRQTFRGLKAWFSYYVLGQTDMNGIVLYDGYAVAQEYPLDEASLSNALAKFQSLYDTYLDGTSSPVYAAIVPDKGYYLPEGYLTMDYGRLFAAVEAGMAYAEFVDVTDTLTLEDYYRTDSHWRQERLLVTAQRICSAMGVNGLDGCTATALERPFYGVYCGQAALPMAAETMYILENPILLECTVTNVETGETCPIYDMDGAEGRDMYDVFLSGAVSLLEIENPSGTEGRELIVFRDSFGSAIIPLLLRDYAKVTVVDIRYISSSLLGAYVDFHGQDVLFLYSTLLLNQSAGLK